MSRIQRLTFRSFPHPQALEGMAKMPSWWMVVPIDGVTKIHGSVSPRHATVKTAKSIDNGVRWPTFDRNQTAHCISSPMMPIYERLDLDGIPYPLLHIHIVFSEPRPSPAESPCADTARINIHPLRDVPGLKVPSREKTWRRPQAEAPHGTAQDFLPYPLAGNMWPLPAVSR